MENKEKKPLFCIAFMKNRTQELEFEYVHAEDALHAKMCFSAAHSKALCKRRISIVEVGPAVGYFTTDDNGDNLVM